MTIGTVERDKLERVRALMGHRLPSGDLAAIFGEALDLLVAKLEKERLGATSRPRPAREKEQAPTTRATKHEAQKAGISGTTRTLALALAPLEAPAKAGTAAIGTTTTATPEKAAMVETTTVTPEAAADVGTRQVPRPVRRAVFMRDGEQCTFRDEEGNRCPARSRLELDHIQAFAHGGAPSVENLRVRCKPHNQLHAEDCFGKEYVKKRIEMRRRVRG